MKEQPRTSTQTSCVKERFSFFSSRLKEQNRRQVPVAPTPPTLFEMLSFHPRHPCPPRQQHRHHQQPLGLIVALKTPAGSVLLQAPDFWLPRELAD